MNTTDANEPTCCICCKGIPLGTAFTPEGVDYVTHFCGLECYQRFVARQKEAGEGLNYECNEASGDIG